VAIDEATGREVRLQAPVVVLATGGINGSHEQVRANWHKTGAHDPLHGPLGPKNAHAPQQGSHSPAKRPMPATMLNGAHPVCRRGLHHWVNSPWAGTSPTQARCGTTRQAFRTPTRTSGHGLSAIPCKSALWLDHRGVRIGPEPLVTGFDTHWLCQRVAEPAQALDLAPAELAHRRQGVRHLRGRAQPAHPRQAIPAVPERDAAGQPPAGRQMQRESPHFLVDDTLAGLAARMNALTASHDIDPRCCRPPPMPSTPTSRMVASCTTTTRFAASCMPASGGPTAAHLLARTAAKAVVPGPTSPSTCSSSPARAWAGCRPTCKAAC
jgi:hypothetical protein